MSEKFTRKEFLRAVGLSTVAAGLSPAVLAHNSRQDSVPAGFARASDVRRPLITHLNPVLRLYPAQAVERTGAVQFGAAELDVMLPFFGDGGVQWTTTVPTTGEYTVAVCYASTRAGIPFKISCGSTAIDHTTEVTEGFYLPLPAESSVKSVPLAKPAFWAQRQFYSFDRVRLPGTIRMNCGVNVVKLRVTGPKGGEIFRLRSLELTPVTRTAEIQQDEARALRHRANTDWFVKAGYGVWLHLLYQTTPRHGPRKPYAEAVADLDVEALARRADEMGAGYVILNTNHGHPTCPAPIKAWEEIHPGWTTKRDLIADLAAALARRNIRLMLYMNCPGLGNLVQLPGTALDRPSYSEERYSEILTRVLSEFGLRYRDHVAGYWFDSWFQTDESYPDLPFETLDRAIKIGNPDCLVAYNYWAFPVETLWQDYWAGELTQLPLRPFHSRYIRHGAGKGLQAHSAIRLDSSWYHIQPNASIGPPLYTAAQLGDYINACMRAQGVVSIGIAIYQNGTLDESSMQVMRDVRRIVRGR